MEFIRTMLIGIVHGITEFLPLSSSGHTGLLENMWVHSGTEEIFFEVLLHTATLLAVIVYFWRDVTKVAAEMILICMDLITNMRIFIENKKTGADKRYQKISGNNYRKLTLMLLTASIPMALLGMLSRRLVQIAFGNLLAIGIGSMISAILLLVIDHIAKGEKIPKDMTFDCAIWMGICQGMAAFPGISRVGVSMAVGLLCGLNRKVAVKFTFLTAIPAIGGALVLELMHLGGLSMTGRLAGTYLCGALAAGITGFLLIRPVVRYLQRARFRGSAFYSFLLGIVAIVCEFMK